jgi:hypothetical protein
VVVDDLTAHCTRSISLGFPGTELKIPWPRKDRIEAVFAFTPPSPGYPKPKHETTGFTGRSSRSSLDRFDWGEGLVASKDMVK